MHNRISTNVRNGKLSFRTFGIFGITLLLAIGATWWFTRNYYQENKSAAFVISKLDSSLINCNNLLQSINSAIINEMDEKLQDPARREKAFLWNPKAKTALELTQEIQQYIQELKSEITGASDNKRIGSKKNFYKPDISDGLFDSLNNFSYNLTNLIPHERINQVSVLPVQALISDKLTKNNHEWYQHNFESLDTNSTLAMLSKIETDVLRSTNIVLNFMNYQNETLIHNCEKYLPLISQNSTVLLPGQVLEITAGIGAYTYPSNPTIQINNNYIPVNDQGIGIYKQNVGSEKEGSVLITISYKDPNTGQLQTMSKSIYYTVFHKAKM